MAGMARATPAKDRRDSTRMTLMQRIGTDKKKKKRRILDFKI
jgi:hypothetical protein